MYVDGLIDRHRRQMDLIHYFGAREAIYHEMGRISRNLSTYLTIKGRTIMRGPFAAIPFAPLPLVQQIEMDPIAPVVAPAPIPDPIIEPVVTHPVVPAEDVDGGGVACMGALMVALVEAPPVWPVPPGGAAQLIALVVAQWAAEATADPS